MEEVERISVEPDVDIVLVSETKTDSPRNEPLDPNIMIVESSIEQVALNSNSLEEQSIREEVALKAKSTETISGSSSSISQLTDQVESGKSDELNLLSLKSEELLFESPLKDLRDQKPIGINTPQKMEINQIATPNSILKYSERDLQRKIDEIKAINDKEMDLIQFELQDLQTKYEETIRKKHQMEIVMKQYENTMKEMVESTKRVKDESVRSVERANENGKRIQGDFEQLQLSFNDLKSRYEETKLSQETAKRNEESLRTIIASLKNDVLISEERYEKLKAHAESKIEEANQQVSKIREGFENEVSTLKVKLSRSEMKINSLENLVESKTKENEELVKICDELIQKMDSK